MIVTLAQEIKKARFSGAKAGFDPSL